MNMYTIDLLQGSGLPLKSRPGRMALALVPVLIPLMAGVLTAGNWMHRETLIKAEQSRVESNDEQLQRFRQDLETYRFRQVRILDAQHRLKVVNKLLTTELAVSPLVLELVRTLPDSVFFQEFELEYLPKYEQKQGEKKGEQRIVRRVRRTLRLSLIGPNLIESDQAVNQYIQDLRNNPALSEALYEVRIVSREPGSNDDMNQVLYSIECQLKEQESEAL